MYDCLVSVIVPTYERNDYLARAIDSIINQTYKNIEIIIVDDNVPNSKYHKKTETVINEYLDKYNIKYIKTTGAIGGGAARNLAIKKATGEYVAFLDDDDCYLPNKIQLQLQFMIKNNLELSYQDIKWVNEEEKLIEYRKLDYVKEFTKNTILKEHILHSLCPTAIYMIKREELLKTKGFGEVKQGQDFIFMLRCIEADMKIGYMSGAYVIQYLHDGERISLGMNKINGENNLYNLKKSYFHLLDKKEKKYVDFRHYAVLSFASFRSKMYGKAIRYAIYTFLISPKYCIMEGKNYFGNRK